MGPGQERRQVNWIQVSKPGFTVGARVSARYAVHRRRCETNSSVRRLAEINEQILDVRQIVLWKATAFCTALQAGRSRVRFPMVS